MSVMIPLTSQIAAMVIIALIGYVMTKTGILDNEKGKALSVVGLYILAPLSVLSAFQTERTAEKITSFSITWAAAICIHLLFLLLSGMLSRGGKSLTRAERALVMFNNAGNLIIPIVQGAFGAEYVFYTVPYMLTQNLFCWTLGYHLINPDRKVSLRSVLRTPMIISICVGLVLFLLNIRLPQTVAAAVSQMGACLGPVCMLAVGVMLAETDLKKCLSDRHLYLLIFLRLIALPLCAVAFLLVIARFWKGPETGMILMITLLGSIGPGNATITQFSMLADHPERGKISSFTAISTLMSAVTIPLIILLFRSLST
ncbi:MAG: AEC family transporter [Lachnospiraceae bacterium]|nr:AEC family transporter [Lachnospiraceae bacterium]